jgi:Ca-activated chloride channel family protein
MGEDLYAILGLDSSADAEQIRLAYVQLARKYHPDVNVNRHDTEFFISIQSAYEVLSNPETRREYDAAHGQGEKPTHPFKTRWVFSRSVLPQLSETQILYGKLTVSFVGGEEGYKTPPSHLCIVLDRSTSMKGERLDNVLRNLRQLIASLRNVDMISIVTFNDKAEVFIAPTNAAGHDVIAQKLNAVQASGGTEMYRGLKAGVDLLWQGHSKDHLLNLLLLTDGHTYGDEDACIELARKAVEKNIRINALGFGTDWNDTFLDTVTSITGGCTYFVRSPNDLPALFMQTLTSIKTTVAHNMNLEIDTRSSVPIKYCFRLDPETVELPVSEVIQLGNLLKERASTYMIAFEVPQIANKQVELSIINGKIRFLMGEAKANSLVMDVSVSLPVQESVEKGAVPMEIVQALSKITLFQMQEKSRRDVQNGNVIDAVRRLNFMATNLIGQGNIQFAKEVLNEAENIKRDQTYSEDGNKRLKYGTRALMLLPKPEKRI